MRQGEKRKHEVVHESSTSNHETRKRRKRRKKRKQFEELNSEDELRCAIKYIPGRVDEAEGYGRPSDDSAIFDPPQKPAQELPKAHVQTPHEAVSQDYIPGVPNKRSNNKIPCDYKDSFFL